MEFVTVVLAGGAARRLGGGIKPARPVAGVPMLVRVLTATADASQRVVVGPAVLQPLLPTEVELTSEHPPGTGPVSAIAAGLAVLNQSLRPEDTVVAVLAADLPFLTSDIIARLRRAIAGHDGAVLIDAANRAQWLCGVWYLSALRARLRWLGDPASRGMRELAQGLSVARVSAQPTAQPPWFDCDTEDDLNQAEEWSHGDAE